MVKNNKIRVGSRAWAEQKARDIEYARKQKQQQENQHKKQQNSKKKEKEEGEEGEKWWKRKEEKNEEQKEQRKERKEKREKKKESEWSKDPIRKIYLEILGLTCLQDNPTSIKRAFRQLALQFHPDKNKSPDAESKMKAFNEAYEYLTGSD